MIESNTIDLQSRISGIDPAIARIVCGIVGLGRKGGRVIENKGFELRELSIPISNILLFQIKIANGYEALLIPLQFASKFGLPGNLAPFFLGNVNSSQSLLPLIRNQILWFYFHLAFFFITIILIIGGGVFVVSIILMIGMKPTKALVVVVVEKRVLENALFKDKAIAKSYFIIIIIILELLVVERELVLVLGRANRNRRRRF